MRAIDAEGARRAVLAARFPRRHDVADDRLERISAERPVEEVPRLDTDLVGHVEDVLRVRRKAARLHQQPACCNSAIVIGVTMRS